MTADRKPRQAHLSERVVARLRRYCRILTDQLPTLQTHIFSHELATLAEVTASQVRHDLMSTGCYGNPTRGYEVADLIRGIGCVIDTKQIHPIALVGLGNIGRAVLTHFGAFRPSLAIVAAFDTDPTKVDRLYNGVPCHGMDDLEMVLAAEAIRAAILAVPRGETQEVANRLVAAGVRGILDFAPGEINVPAWVYVEPIDLSASLEKVAYFAGRNPGPRPKIPKMLA